MNTSIEAVLERKFQDSYRDIKRERQSNTFFGVVEIALVIGGVIGFLYFLAYVFWGAGYSEFSAAHHDYAVSLLLELPGPHQPMVTESLESNGYVSLVDYSKFVEMANNYKELSRIKP